MREPMFRVWDTESKQMVYLNDAVLLNNREAIPMLFSQVYDAGGKRVYEGDVVTTAFKSNAIAWEVFFSQGTFWCKPIDGDGQTTEELHHLSSVYHTYVIGNVWETENYKRLGKDTRSEHYMEESRQW